MNENHTDSTPDIRERGKGADGSPTFSDRRLYLQLLAFTDVYIEEELVSSLRNSSFTGALYKDLNDPAGVALVTVNEQPEFFTTELREYMKFPPFCDLEPRPDMTMFGRTYSIGYEADLDNVLLKRPIDRLCNPEHRWAIWYPLRRNGEFALLSPKEQSEILGEHGKMGAGFSVAGHGQDIRLACHGLDANDNDFLIGLVGSNLHPLSAMVQAMRKTKQTSTYLESLGPFFIGQALWQSRSDNHGLKIV